MPNFVVVFDTAVTYLADHPKGQRQIEPGVVGGLRVSAPTAHGAMVHATRTTRGAGSPSAVYDESGVLVWGVGPESILIPPAASAPVESPVGEVAGVFGA